MLRRVSETTAFVIPPRHNVSESAMFTGNESFVKTREPCSYRRNGSDRTHTVGAELLFRGATEILSDCTPSGATQRSDNCIDGDSARRGEPAAKQQEGEMTHILWGVERGMSVVSTGHLQRTTSGWFVRPQPVSQRKRLGVYVEHTFKANVDADTRNGVW